jgi:organic hydroperoxide reductase OsmC/OhrA
MVSMVNVERKHRYEVSVRWTGNRGPGTADYRAYGREHEVSAAGPGTLLGSSDPVFRGDATRWNPEQLLLAAAAQCHLLSYLHAAAVSGVVVIDYVDAATAVMEEDGRGGGRFVEITLRPVVTVASADQVDTAERLHEDANRMCFIAASLAVPVRHEARTVVAGADDPQQASRSSSRW